MKYALDTRGYDNPDVVYLGDFTVDDVRLNKLSDNLLKHYTLNGIDTQRNDHLVVYDPFLEQPVAQVVFSDTQDLLTPLNNLLYGAVSVFNVIDEPEIKSKKIIKHTGFFVGNKKLQSDEIITPAGFVIGDNVDAYGQVFIKNVDQQLSILIEAFSIDYEKNDYVSIPSYHKSKELKPSLCVSNSFSECISPTNDKLKINAGDNLFILHDTDFGNLTSDDLSIFIHDEKNVLAYIPIKEYGVARISLESFVDWFQYSYPFFLSLF